VTVAPPPPAQENPASQNDVWAVELPYGMPKDSHLLPQHSQDLLRAARSGRIYKRPAPPEEEEIDVDAVLGDKPEKKDEDPKNTGFTARAWKLIPRHMEGPDIEYLAKRRKGVVTAAQKSTGAAAPVLTKATVKRMDAAGNEYLQDVVVPQGQPVDGEVISQRVIHDPNAAALGDGSLVPSRRKVPPPRKKSKGIGKGKRKKANPPAAIPLANGVPQGTEGAGAAMDQSVSLQYQSPGAATKFTKGIKIENENSVAPEDTEMADGSMAASDDEEGEDGEEVEEGDDDDDDKGTPVDQSTSPKPPQQLPPAPDNISTEDAPSADIPDPVVADAMHIDPPEPENAEQKAEENAEENTDVAPGSPLENVALTTSTLSPPGESPAALTPTASEDVDKAPETTVPATVDEVMQQDAVETGPTALPPPPPEPTGAEAKAAVEVRQEEEEEEEMLLDIVDQAQNARIGAGEVLSGPAPEVVAPQVEVSPVITEAEVEPMAEPQEEKAEAAAPEEEEEDNLPDLLGGLEKQLNESMPEKAEA
jgi:hypothetical protein